jgi:hypothetical protein
MAASSVFQRSSWKFDQDTPMILPFACASGANENVIAAPASKAAINFPMISSLRRTGALMDVGLWEALYFELRKK